MILVTCFGKRRTKLPFRTSTSGTGTDKTPGVGHLNAEDAIVANMKHAMSNKYEMDVRSVAVGSEEKKDTKHNKH